MDTPQQGTQLTRSEMIHKLMYLFQTGAKQLSSLIQVLENLPLSRKQHKWSYF